MTARAERPARVKLAKQITALLSPGRTPQKGACKAGSGAVSSRTGEVIENVIWRRPSKGSAVRCCGAKERVFDQKRYPRTLICGPLTHCHSAFGECFTTPPFSKYLILLKCPRSTLLLTVWHWGTLSRWGLWRQDFTLSGNSGKIYISEDTSCLLLVF